jgi:hypothetical protein
VADALRSGQPRRHDDDRVQKVLGINLNRRPMNMARWSVRRLTRESDLKSITALAPKEAADIMTAHSQRGH